MPDYTTLSKDALLAKMEEVYAKAKPHQDALTENTVEILEISAEVYRRIMVRVVPDAIYTRTRVLTRISCTKNCLGEPAHELARRLNRFAAEGVKVVRIEFDVNLHEYTIHGDPDPQPTS